ncbi:MAG: NADP-dependent oxidoreductase [Gammaproteobacteria bacterium]|nr:NADP-dependent oxidoreductase [Gammaproteobacteria bacterium]
MSEPINLQIRLTERPNGKLSPKHFATSQSEIPPVEDGKLLVRTVLLSLDAANRAWMQGPTYRRAVKPGDVMHGYGLGEVMASGSSAFAAGDIVACETGWQNYSLVDAGEAVKQIDHRPLSHLLSVLGIAGKTAYHGLLGIGQPQPGETVVVSAAAGSVGVYVGQLAQMRGARAVGIAGGREKCDWLTGTLGFDAAIDYKSADMLAELKAHCPKGIDVYFDNVGGPVLEAVLFNMAMGGRVVCCGAVSQYDTGDMASPRGIPGLIVVKRLRMEGFIVLDERHDDQRASADLLAWSTSGKLRVVDTILDGLESAPGGLIGLLAGENMGKWLVQVGADPQGSS